MNLQNYGFAEEPNPLNTGGIPARITAVHRDRFEIICDNGAGFAKVKTAEYRERTSVPVVGDFVMLDWQKNGDSRILKTLPRKSVFSRLDPSSAKQEEQEIAANFEYVFLLQAIGRDFNPRRLERYLTLAWESGAIPVVVLTKADTAEDNLQELISSARQTAIGADVYAISSKTGEGLDSFEHFLLPGKTILLLGSSGVGKSTLVNALAEDKPMITGSVRKKDGRGRHTTSHRQLIMLKSGAMFIDTPGLREVGLVDSTKGLEQNFSDVEQYLGNCKFNDCRHSGEPGCNVAEAIRQGDLSPERWESYQKLHTELSYSNDKAIYMQNKKTRFKEISKFRKTLNNKSSDYRNTPCTDSFHCQNCGSLVTPENAGSDHRNHCPHCLSSLHLDNRPGDRASLCKGIMEPIAIWVRKNGEWAIIHRCKSCGKLSSNRIAADDNMQKLIDIALKPFEVPLTIGKDTMAKSKSHEPKFCKICRTELSDHEQSHCSGCFSGIHKEKIKGLYCDGTLEPVSVWIRDNGSWEILQRCRSCGKILSSPTQNGDNYTLLLSIAMKPLASPPFPLWKKTIT